VMLRESASRFVQPQPLDKNARGHSEVFFEPAAEVTRTEMRLCGESFDRQVLSEVGSHPGNEIGKVVGSLNLKLQRLRVLLLPTRALQVNDEFSRDSQGYSRTVIFLTQR